MRPLQAIEDPLLPIASCQHYFVVGSDAFLQREVVSALMPPEALRDRIELTPQMDWSALFLSLQSPPLFEQLRVICIKILPKGLTKTQVNQFMKLAQPLPGVRLLFLMEQWPLREAWWSVFAAHSVLIHCALPSLAASQAWLSRLAANKGIVLTNAHRKAFQPYLPQQLAAVKDWFDHPEGPLPPLEVAEVSPTEWIRSLMEGAGRRACEQLKQFKLQQRSPLILMRSLQPYLLALMAEQYPPGGEKQALLRHIDARTSPGELRAVAKRISPKLLASALALLYRVEHSLKATPLLDPWEALGDCVQMLTTFRL